MASLVRKSGFERVGMRPSAAGTLSRLACARAREAGIEVAPLMAKAGVTSRQVEDDNVWLSVQGQIKFLERSRTHCRMIFSDFILRATLIFARSGCSITS
jgi:hypothetical protein